MSSKAVFDGVKALRGGIPLCFPQFGPGELVQHGFARTALWRLISQSSSDENGCTSVTLELNDKDIAANAWKGNKFTAQYKVSLTANAKLKTTFSVKNENSTATPFNFQLALHTYFQIPNIHHTSIHGLNQLQYIDKLRQAQEFTEDSGSAGLKITSEVDRVYKNTPAITTITSSAEAINSPSASPVTISIWKSAELKDSVVWNIWNEKIKNVADLHPEDYLKYVCVESGAISTPVTLQSGASWEATQELSAENL